MIPSAAAAAAPRSFWQKRGLDVTPDGREFRTILPAAPSALDGISLGADRRAERVLGTSDLLEVVFLQAALAVARTVARVRVNGATGVLRGYGTGFMVSPRLLLTNWHVLPTPDVAAVSTAEFGFETRLGEGAPQAGATFKLEPTKFFLAEEALDYALVAVAPIGSAGKMLAEFGFNRLIDNDTDLITKGQFANIIQHPSGQPKQLAFRQNEIVGKVDDFLQYRTDTAPGSSGAPVFNDQWQVVALHHAGVWATNEAGQILAVDGSVWTEAMGDDRIKWIANEGVRVPCLVNRWRNAGQTLPAGFIDEILHPNAPSVTEGVTLISSFDDRSVPASAAIDPVRPDPSLTATIAPDGTATWTLPLRISVSLGQHPAAVGDSAAATHRAGDAEAPAGRAGTSKTKDEAPQDFETVLRKARETLMQGRTDVIGIRAGWYYGDDGITDRRAIVVTVRRRKTPAELQADRVTELPTSFMGYPVQVAGPTVEELLRASAQPVATEALFGATASPFEIKYVPPEGLDLRPVEARMRVIAHVSPDAGWPTLKTFIAGARSRLTAAMYEFTAEHIREALTEVAQKRSFKTLSLTLDSVRGSLRNPDTVRDSDAMVRDLREALDDKLEVSWVKIGSVNGWVNHDYHIKVMVRDGTAFWLSSGNWKDSGQPDADPRGDDALLRRLIGKQNREWHAIIEHKGLAETYELAIRGDFNANRGTRPEELATVLPELYYLPSAVRAEAREAERPLTYFGPFEDERVFKVQPILTPDNYLAVVLPAIKAARSSLLIQNQSLATPPDNPDDRYVEFWNVVRDQQRRGRDVRLIFRIMERAPWDARATHEKLRDLGLDPKRIKVQFGCHTKGIVIDGERVILGSHNLTNIGATTNRDASLLFDDAPLAEYFGRLFEHDWENVAVKVTPSLWKRGELRLAERGVAPEGFLPFDWADWMEAQ